ncbi:hypothetical protein JCM8202_001104 [Rhodotorula sphaerocarpa]
MSLPANRRTCFVCGKPGHIAAACTSTERLCYNCGEPGHESSACPNPKVADNKQCYSCGGMGHVVAECPSIRVGAFNAAGPKCYNCQQFGHIARTCPNAATIAAGAAAADAVGVPPAAAVMPTVAPVAPFPRVPLGARVGGYAGRGGFMGGAARGGLIGGAQRRCYGCGGVGHQARKCPTAAALAAPRPPKTCYNCQEVGHIARDCPTSVVAVPVVETEALA